MSPGLISPLRPDPVAGVAMGNVALLRLDLAGGLAPGNKHFKLQPSIEQARRLGISRLLSFGGPWSNHLHALAAVGREQGLATVGIVRGGEQEPDTAMLADARAWGMRIARVSRQEYRRRHQADYCRQLQRRFGPCLVIPEGGGNAAGVRGCLAIADLLAGLVPGIRRVVVPVGTGTTLAGLAAGLGESAPGCEVLGVSALRGASDLEHRVGAALSSIGAASPARWQICHDGHCGGFARASEPLRQFMLAFERVQGVALEPVYTGKMLFAIHRRLQRGEWDPEAPLVAVHTGGLQGRRGFPWLCGGSEF